MAYGLKYRFKFENIHGVTYEVKLLEDGFSGTVKVRPLGAAPVIRMQTSGPFRSTCCELVLECQDDGEFADLYSTEPTQYKVEVYHGSTPIWYGFIATELYSEPDIAPPYDVRVTATDGLGVLKEYDFVPVGAQTIRTHMKTFLAQTGLELGIYSVFSIHEHGDTVINFLDKVLIDLDYHDGDTVYDTLSDLLDTLRCTITQWNCDWLLVRETDISVNNNGRVPGYFSAYSDSSLTYSLNIDNMTATVGKMGVADMWPVGYLTRRISPAKKSVKVSAPWHWKSGFPEVKNDGWTTSGSVSFVSAGKYYSIGQASLQPAQMQGTLAASVILTRFTSNFKVTVRASGILGIVQGYAMKSSVQVLAAWTDIGTGTVYYYNPDSGWSTSSGAGGEYHDINSSNPTHDINASEEISVEIPAAVLNSNGVLTVNVKCQLAEVYAVSVEPSGVRGYEDQITIQNNARGTAEPVQISGARVTTGNFISMAFLRGAFYTVTSSQGATTTHVLTSFDDNDNSQLDYMSLTALNCAKVVASPRIEITGKIDFPLGRFQQPLVIKSHNVWALMESYDWDLMDAEINFKATTIPTATLNVDSEEITTY